MQDSSNIQETTALASDQPLVFEPPHRLQKFAHIGSYEQYKKMYDDSVTDPEKFWAEQAALLDWFKPFKSVCEGSFEEGDHQWYVGGKLNVSVNCIDRHMSTWRKNKAAILWQGEKRDETRVLTYNDLYNSVCRCANMLKKWGVRKGDRVAIYMPMIPELAIATLACARIGAVHNIVFGGFSPDSLRERINDSGARLLITADASMRKGTIVPLKDNADKALEGCPGIHTCIVVKHTASDINFGRTGTNGGTMKSTRPTLRIPVRLKSWILRILYSYYIPRAAQENRKECCIRPEDTWFIQH